MKRIVLSALALALGLVWNQSPAIAADKIKFKNPDKTEVYIIKSKDYGFKLVDGTQKLIAKYKFKDTRLKVKNADGQEMGVISGNESKLKIKKNKRTIYVLKAQAKGAFKVKDENDNTIYKLKPKDYGLKIKNGEEKLVGKTKRKGDKIKLFSADGKLVISTKAAISLLAASCANFEKIPVALRMGMLLQLTRKQ